MYPKFCVIFFPTLPTHSRSVYDPTEMILAIFFYSKVPHMLHAKYQPNWHSGSGEEVVRTFFTIYGHGGHLEFQKINFLAKFCKTNILMLNVKFH